MWAADSGEDLNRDLSASGEPWHPSVAKWGHPSVQPAVRTTVYETWLNQNRRDQLATRWNDRWNDSTSLTGSGRPFDALICPATPFPALKHQSGDETCGTLEYVIYGCLSPLLGLSTGVFPVTTVDQKLDVIPGDFKPISADDDRVMQYCSSSFFLFTFPSSSSSIPFLHRLRASSLLTISSRRNSAQPRQRARWPPAHRTTVRRGEDCRHALRHRAGVEVDPLSK